MSFENANRVMHKLEDLKIWHRSNDLVLLIYKVVAEFPANEMYSLTSQLKGSAISISSNIAKVRAETQRVSLSNFSA